MSSSAADNAAEPASDRQRLPLIFIGIVVVEVLTIAALYYIGVYYG